MRSHDPMLKDLASMLTIDFAPGEPDPDGEERALDAIADLLISTNLRVKARDDKTRPAE